LIVLLSVSIPKAHCQTDSVLISYKEYVRAKEDLRAYKKLKVEVEVLKKELESERSRENTVVVTPITEEEFKKRLLNCEYLLNSEKEKTATLTFYNFELNKEVWKLRNSVGVWKYKASKQKSQDRKDMKLFWGGMMGGLVIIFVMEAIIRTN
jgi:hypothetical protein